MKNIPYFKLAFIAVCTIFSLVSCSKGSDPYGNGYPQPNGAGYTDPAGNYIQPAPPTLESFQCIIPFMPSNNVQDQVEVDIDGNGTIENMCTVTIIMLNDMNKTWTVYVTPNICTDIRTLFFYNNSNRTVMGNVQQVVRNQYDGYGRIIGYSAPWSYKVTNGYYY